MILFKNISNMYTSLVFHGFFFNVIFIRKLVFIFNGCVEKLSASKIYAYILKKKRRHGKVIYYFSSRFRIIKMRICTIHLYRPYIIN